MTEKLIAKYILENKNEVLKYSAQILGEKTNTSAAAVIRFSKKIGCKGFSDLKMNLAQSNQVEESNSGMDIIFGRDDDIASLVDKGCLIVQLSKIFFVIRFLCVRSFIILLQFFLFVKNFFNLFCCSELFCSATTFISYHLSPCLSRSFLMIFIMYRSDRSPSVTFT